MNRRSAILSMLAGLAAPLVAPPQPKMEVFNGEIAHVYLGGEPVAVGHWVHRMEVFDGKTTRVYLNGKRVRVAGDI